MTFAEYLKKYPEQPTAVTDTTTEQAPDDKEKKQPQNEWTVRDPKGTVVMTGDGQQVKQANAAIQASQPGDVLHAPTPRHEQPQQGSQLAKVQTSQANRQTTGNDAGQAVQQPKQYNGTYDSSSVVPMGSYGEAPRIVPREEGVKSPSYYVDSNGVEHWEGRAMNEGEPTTAYSTETLPTQKAPEQSTAIERPAGTWDKDKVARAMQAINRMGLNGNDYNPIDLGYATQISDPEKWNSLTDAEKNLVSQAVGLANKTDAVSVDDIVNGNIGIDADKAKALKERMPQSAEEAKIIGNAKPSGNGTVPTGLVTGMTIEPAKKDGTKTGDDSKEDDGTNGPSLEDFYKSLNADPTLSDEELRRRRRRELAQRAIAGIGDVGAAVANWSGAMHGGSSFDIPEDSTLTKLYGDRWDKWRKDYEERQEKYRNGLQAVRLQDIQQARADRKEALAEKKQDDLRKEYESKQDARQREQDRKDELLTIQREKASLQERLYIAQANLAEKRGTLAEKQAENYEKLLTAQLDLLNAREEQAKATTEATKSNAALAVKVATAKVNLMNKRARLAQEQTDHPEKFKGRNTRNGRGGLTEEEYDQIFMDLPEATRQQLLSDFGLGLDDLHSGDTRRMVMKNNADNGGSSTTSGGRRHLQGL